MTGGPSAIDVIKKKLCGMQLEIEELQTAILRKSDDIKQHVCAKESAEAEVAAMTRRIRLLEEDLEVSSSRLTETTAKLEEASKTAEESERLWRGVENRLNTYDKNIEELEKTAEEAVFAAEEADRKYKEISRNLALTEESLQAAESRIAVTEARTRDLESELKALTSALKAQEIKHEQSLEDEKTLEERLVTLKQQVEEAESRAAAAEMEMNKRTLDIKRAKDQITAEHSAYETLRQQMDSMINELHSI